MRLSINSCIDLTLSLHICLLITRLPLFVTSEMLEAFVEKNASLHLEDNTSALWSGLLTFLRTDMWILLPFFFCGTALFGCWSKQFHIFHGSCLYKERSVCCVAPAVNCATALFDFALSFSLCRACFSHYVKVLGSIESLGFTFSIGRHVKGSHSRSPLLPR